MRRRFFAYLRSGSRPIRLRSGIEGDLVKVRLLATVAALILSTVLGCHFESRNPPSTKTLQVPMNDVLTQSDISQNITLAVGNTLVVQLGSNYTTPTGGRPTRRSAIRRSSSRPVTSSSHRLRTR